MNKHQAVTADMVGAVLLDRNKILLGLRASHKSFANCWDMPGGHVENGETPLDALRREFVEEIGVAVVDAHHLRDIDMFDRAGRVSRLRAYVVTHWQGTPSLANDEHVELRWFYVDELPSEADLACREYIDLFKSLRATIGSLPKFMSIP